MSHVVLHVWRVPLRRLPLALLRMAVDRLRLRRADGAGRPIFAKLLGTGHGRTFDARDADLRTWALLTTWPDRDASLRFEAHATPRGWRRIAEEEWRADLTCLQSRGEWAGSEPFVPAEGRAAWDGPVASLTRARIKPSMWGRFWRSVPAVVEDLDVGVGPLARIGIGEAPVGLQGTFTVWPDAAALTDFAHRRAPHRRVVGDTRRLGWYAEELFARFALTDERGVLFGRPAPVATSARSTGGPDA